MPVRRIPAAVLLSLLFACGTSESRAPGAAADTAAMSSSGPRPTAMGMLPGIRAHFDSVAAKPAMLHSSMASHQAEVKAVVEAMHADMMAAGMHSDAAYEALADSVVRGSAALGTASGKNFDRLVTEHVDQMRRLTAAYESKATAM